MLLLNQGLRKKDFSTVKEPVELKPEVIKVRPENKPTVQNFDYSFKTVFLSKHKDFVVTELKKAQSPFYLIQLGDIKAFKEDYPGALKMYKQAIEKDKTLIPAYINSIRVLLRLKKLARVKEVYEDLLKVTNNRPDFLHEYLLIKLALNPQNKDVGKEVLRKLDTILEKNKDNVEVINTYGFVLLNYLNEVSEAAKYFRKALSIRGDFTMSLNNLGVCFVRKGQSRNAEKHFRKVIEIRRKFALAYENLAALYIKKGQIEEAFKILDEAKKSGVLMSPNWQQHVCYLLLRLEQFDKAKEWYLKKIIKEPENFLLFNNLGNCYQGLNDFNSAEESYKTAIKLFEKDEKRFTGDKRFLFSYYNLGRLRLFHKEDISSVEEIYKKILELNPKDAVGSYLEGAYYTRYGDYEKANESLDKSLAIDDSNKNAYIDKSFLLDSIFRDYQGTIDLINKATKKGLNHELLDNNLIVAYIKLEKLDKAKPILDKYDKTEFDFLLATKGLYEMRRNNLSSGNRYYKKAINKFTGNRKRDAKQIWLYEKALYWYRHKEFTKAKTSLNKAKSLGSGYMYHEIYELEKKF